MSSEEALPLRKFVNDAYHEYSMYVILDRALPAVHDGLKPVQRRIVYAMSELGLSSGSKHKKSARTVGDVLGKYHPHGDTACYEAMALMAQPFSYRHPLVDGQGNWGSQDDPKSFAAMRYTESRLTAYAQTLLTELGQGCVDWKDNFDATMQEPVTLPAQVPNILLNGVTGIAVGMSTNIPPHNLKEVVSACLHLIDAPGCTDDTLFGYIPGPDYPTHAEIVTKQSDIQKAYKTGHGSIKMRAVYDVEGNCAAITDLPHQVSGSKIIESIAALMIAKKLPMVKDIRDESDHQNPIRIVIVTDRKADVDAVMGHLFAKTELEKSYPINLNMIGLNGLPQVKSLRTTLLEWIEYRIQTVTRRLEHRLDKVNKRLEVIEGLLVAYLNIDEVIHIIRTEENPGKALIAKFGITEFQSEAILNIKLRSLAKLEEVKLNAEKSELNIEKTELERILGDESAMKKLVKAELRDAAKLHGNDRRSALVERVEAKQLDTTALITSEPITVVVSAKGWIRSGKGHDIDPAALSYREGDKPFLSIKTKSTNALVITDDTGRVYTIAAHDLPSARGQGEPLISRLKPPSGAKFNYLMSGKPEEMYLIASNTGYGFRVKLSDMLTKNKAGKPLITLKEGQYMLMPIVCDGYQLLAITKAGRALSFPVSDLPHIAKGKGNKIIVVSPKDLESGEDELLGLACLPENGSIELTTTRKTHTLNAKEIEYYAAARGRRGLFLPKNMKAALKVKSKKEGRLI